MKQKTLVWFRQDLRLADNPALHEAVKNGSIMAIYILDDKTPGEFKMGEASRWYLHYSLASLNKSLDNQLNFYCGDALTIILELVKKHNITAVYWNRCYEPWRIKADAALKSKLAICKSFNGSLLWEPWQVLKNDGTPYKVFTPYYKNGCLQKAPPRIILAKPKKINLIKDDHGLNLDDLKLLPIMKFSWKVGEAAAHKKLNKFLKNNLETYKENRDFPAKQSTSYLSPCLHFGELSPNQIWYGTPHEGADFLRQLVWREFSYYLLYHFPTLPVDNFQKKFNVFSWRKSAKNLKAWQQGKTGYPLIDAGMRELWQTGYMHNRVRMVVGSFLVKNLLIHWHEGEAWFWDCLVDADLANNSASWQWVAGTGADAAPYFRIFNPITQGEKFDKEGEYTRHFVPELRDLPNRYLFKPWLAPEAVLKSAGIELGITYPKPIVDLSFSRKRALEAYAKSR
ncbi:MAG: deoxyribodipyrimidine photo-lyase [Legionellales bacterium]|jgi:deoxyribodipyrimidine photo-lyase